MTYATPANDAWPERLHSAGQTTAYGLYVNNIYVNALNAQLADAYCRSHCGMHRRVYSYQRANALAGCTWRANHRRTR
jgi:hypothetical protein